MKKGLTYDSDSIPILGQSFMVVIFGNEEAFWNKGYLPYLGRRLGCLLYHVLK